MIGSARIAAVPQNAVPVLFCPHRARSPPEKDHRNYAFDIQPNHPQLRYVEQLQKYYKALYDKKIPVDFVQGKACRIFRDLLCTFERYHVTPFFNRVLFLAIQHTACRLKQAVYCMVYWHRAG